MADSAGEPRVLVAIVDRWPCVLVCAELRERGHVAQCVHRLATAILLSDAADDGPLRAIVCDREGLHARDIATLQWLRALGAGPAIALVMAAGTDLPCGPWDRVLRRPATIGTVVDVVEQLLEESPDSRPDLRDDILSVGIRMRLGAPWPLAACSRCGTARHCEPPWSTREREGVRIALVQFALEHEPCLAGTAASLC